MKRPTSTIKDRIDIGAELLYSDGRNLVEKVTVVEINKKDKTATLSNRVVINRHPDNEGNFLKVGFNRNKGAKIQLLTEENKIFYKASKSRAKLYHLLPIIKEKILDKSSNILNTDLDTLANIIAIEKSISKLIK